MFGAALALALALQAQPSEAPWPEFLVPLDPARARVATAAEVESGLALAERFECNRCHERRGLAVPPPDKRCVGCHAAIHAGTFDAPPDVLHRWQAHIVDLTVAPSFDGAERRLRQSWVREFLLRPHDLRPNLSATMPRLALTPEQATALAQWLVPDGTPFDPDAQPMLWFASKTTGRALAEQRGCGTCHRMRGLEGGLAASAVPVELPAAALTDGMLLAPDLALTRTRFQREALVAWLRDPPAMKPGTAMPKLNLTEGEAEDLAVFLLDTPLAPPPASPVAGAPLPPRLPLLTRRVPFAEVRDHVFKKTCWHCHSEPDLALGDGGPGNTGGFGFLGRGLSFVNYETIMAGSFKVDGGGADQARQSIFKRLDNGLPKLVAHLVARQVEEAGGEVPGVRGMPLGLPSVSPEDLQLIESWIAQGRPE